MVEQTATPRASWVWLLGLFTFGSFDVFAIFPAAALLTLVGLGMLILAQRRKVETAYQPSEEKVS